MGGRVDTSVVDVPERERYEVSVGGELAGFVQYRVEPGVIAFVHTEIESGHEGKGLGGTLVKHALDDARRRQLRVRPFCPFVRGYIAKHSDDYADLVDDRERFEL